VVVNESLVKHYFKNQEPLGKRVLIQQIITGKHELGPEVPWQVVGVVADEKVDSLDDSRPGVYVSYKQSPANGNALIVRGVMDPNRLIKSVQRAVWECEEESGARRCQASGTVQNRIPGRESTAHDFARRFRRPRAVCWRRLESTESSPTRCRSARTR